MKNDEKEIRRHAVPRVRLSTTNFYTVHYIIYKLKHHKINDNFYQARFFAIDKMFEITS